MGIRGPDYVAFAPDACLKAPAAKQQLTDPVLTPKSHTLALSYFVNRPGSTVPVMFGVGSMVLPQSIAHFGFQIAQSV